MGWWDKYRKKKVEYPVYTAKDEAATKIRAILGKFSRPDGKEIISMVLKEMNPEYHLKHLPYTVHPRKAK